MANTAPVPLRVLASTVSIVRKVDKIIKEVLDKGDLGVVDKGQNDPQTEADRSAQMCIVQSLHRKFPGLTIIAEEDLADSSVIPEDWIVNDEDEDVLSKECPSKYDHITENDIVVWVDPLDGTREFTIGLIGHVTVLVGIAFAGRPIAGVIHQPYYTNDGVPVSRTIWGMKDVGYAGFVPKYAPEDKMIVTVTRSHSCKALEDALVKLKPDEIIRVGGAGHKVLLVLEGKAHGFIVPTKGMKRWDICACEAILEIVGGTLTDIYGDNYMYDKETSHENVNGSIATLTKNSLDIFVELFKNN